MGGVMNELRIGSSHRALRSSINELRSIPLLDATTDETLLRFFTIEYEDDFGKYEFRIAHDIMGSLIEIASVKFDISKGVAS